MTITYQWKFQRLEVALTYQGLTDVIRVVHWRYVGTDEDGINFEAFGEMAFSDPDPQNFVPFASVTAEQVEGWVAALLGDDAVNALQAEINTQITAQQNPPLIAMQLTE